MSRNEFVTAAKVWLGLPVLPVDLRCTCGRALCEFGDHLLGCRGLSGLRIRRHDELKSILFHALLLDDRRAKMEQRCAGDGKARPGDVYHPNFLEGKPAYFDISVRNTLQPQFLNQAAAKPGAAGIAGEEEKDEKNNKIVESCGGKFYPLVVETLGMWTSFGLEMIKIVASRVALTQNQGLGQAVRELHERFSVCL